jgi:hypothetical protein
MITTYPYLISVNIPGGLVTADTIVRLTILCRINIVTPLAYIRVVDDILSIAFTDALSPTEKIVLDENTLPAGGLLEQCADYVEILVNALPIPNNAVLSYPSDGFSHLDFTLRLKSGDGNTRLGESPNTYLASIGVLLVDRENGVFDPLTGEITFRLMPSRARIRGRFPLQINTENLPTRMVIIHME